MRLRPSLHMYGVHTSTRHPYTSVSASDNSILFTPPCSRLVYYVFVGYARSLMLPKQHYTSCILR